VRWDVKEGARCGEGFWEAYQNGAWPKWRYAPYCLLRYCLASLILYVVSAGYETESSILSVVSTTLVCRKIVYIYFTETAIIKTVLSVLQAWHILH